MPRPRCYLCGAFATSKEHVPPRNLFPEAKDVEGLDFRRNLITVRSCDEHNSEKSHHDQFLMVSLAGIVGNNSIGYMHGMTKVDRAMRISAGRLLDQVLIEKKEVLKIDLGDNRFTDIIVGTPDVQRLRECFEHIAYGLHQAHYRRRFVGKVNIFLGYLFHADGNSKTFAEFIADKVELELKDKPRLGSNQEVFYYQVSEPDQFGLYMIRAVFYGGLSVFMGFHPEGVQPPANLAAELMAMGVKTVLTLGSKEYVFEPHGKPAEAFKQKDG